MSQPRLVLFLADIEGNLTALRQTLSRACETAHVPLPDVRWVEAATPMTDAGWRVAEVKLQPSGGKAVPEDHLDSLVRAVARDFRDQAVGLYTDKAGSYGRASLSEPGRPSRSLEGEYIDVVRQTARWLGVEAPVLGRLLDGGATARNLLAAAVDFGNEEPQQGAASQGKPSRRGEQPPAPPPEPDEDDRFVEAKLVEARRLMEQYLSHRK
ncbi:hypothetical protein [Cystobacter ferrugineus]|uniref:Uncharacterized protein n=1 Tax=Cystobacter ferrugineus TaxID=83449 RepID=A0A1L9B4D1_9BACT|nr:hypothetical protein [Cystobacter ferrugineus]OJH37119.1 hypothetical protein BON30_27705 [Cystobacter ferrugineus]